MVFFKLKREIDESVRSLYNHLKRSGWGDTVELLSAYTNCEEHELPHDFSFNGDNDDSYKVVMKPVEHPTELFTSLHQRDWGTALNCLHRKPSEARTWIYCETDFPHNEMLWKQLPLHSSIALGAPAYLILALLDAYPEAAKKWDLKKSLPIHLAASRVDVDVDGERILQHLLRVFPESAGVENGKGRTPIELAYGAQLRKEKQNKSHPLKADIREPEEEGFELQLEMRDVMESFKGDDNNDPSTWSLADTWSSSFSYSTRSEKTDTTSTSLGKSTLGMISESSVSGDASSSCSTGSLSIDGTKSLAFQSVQMKSEGLSLTSSVSLATSTDSSVCESFSLSQKSTGGLSPEDKPKTSTSNRELTVEKHVVGLTQRKSEDSSKSCELNGSLPMARSHDLPPKPSIYSTPVRSLSSPPLQLKPGSRKREKKTSINCYLIGAKSNPDRGGNRKNSSSVNLDDAKTASLHRNPQLQQQKGHEQARSFEVPPRQSMYSSSTRSLPSPLKMLKSRSRSVQKQADIDCDSFKNDCNKNIVDRYSSPMDLHELMAACPKSSPSEFQQQKVCEHARSFDVPPRESTYSSPAQSLPASLEDAKKIFDNVGWKSRLDKGYNSIANDSRRDKTVSAHSTTSREILQRRNDCNRSLGRVIKSETRDVIKKDSIVDYSSTDVSPKNTNERYLCPERSKDVREDCSVMTEGATPLCGTWHQNEFIAEHETRSDGEGSEDLRLLVIVESEKDDHSDSPPFLNRDPVLVDFIEEAIINTGWKSGSVKSVLKEMEKKNVRTIEDLLKVGPDDFSPLFPDRELAMEMKRLLGISDCESTLESIDEDEDFLRSSSGSSSLFQ